jgi:hypothetical protein
MVKSGMRLVETVALMVGARNDHINERRPVRRWEINRKSDCKGIMWEHVVSILSAGDRNQCEAPVNMGSLIF